jgi:ATP-dependent RNA helicase UAP56/SUB2
MPLLIAVSSTLRKVACDFPLSLLFFDVLPSSSTAVQHETIPQAMLGQDLVCQAKSGMGKTCVFVLSILQQLDAEKSPKPSAIVLCHTRELAHQITNEFKRLNKYLPGITVEEIYGGVPIGPQKEKLKKETPHIVVGTPGRVMDLVKQKALDLSQIKHFVMDECDQLLGVAGTLQSSFDFTMLQLLY